MKLSGKLLQIFLNSSRTSKKHFKSEIASLLKVKKTPQHNLAPIPSSFVVSVCHSLCFLFLPFLRNNGDHREFIFKSLFYSSSNIGIFFLFSFTFSQIELRSSLLLKLEAPIAEDAKLFKVRMVK